MIYREQDQLLYELFCSRHVVSGIGPRGLSSCNVEEWYGYLHAFIFVCDHTIMSSNNTKTENNPECFAEYHRQ